MRVLLALSVLCAAIPATAGEHVRPAKSGNTIRLTRTWDGRNGIRTKIEVVDRLGLVRRAREKLSFSGERTWVRDETNLHNGVRVEFIQDAGLVHVQTSRPYDRDVVRGQITVYRYGQVDVAKHTDPPKP